MLFSAAEEWLNGNYRRLEIPNPRYEALCEARSLIARQQEVCDQAIDAAEKYVAAVAASRKETWTMAKLAYARVPLNFGNKVKQRPSLMSGGNS